MFAVNCFRPPKQCVTSDGEIIDYKKIESIHSQSL